jgi:hypothetical protein
MDDLLTRLWTDLVGRLTGPLSMRLFLQPVMASLLAVRDGLKDAKAGQLLRGPTTRLARRQRSA